MKTYLINLDRSPDRLEFFSDQARMLGLAFERVLAIDGRSLPESTWKAIVDERFEFQPVNVYEVAVFLSHKAIWERMIRDRVSMAAVFEDDAILAPQIVDTFRSIENAKLSFDVVKLETTLRSVVLKESHTCLASGETLHQLKSWHGGAAGYVISLQGAEKLSKATNLISDQVDQAMFNPLSKISSSLKILQCKPALCIQKDLQHRGQPATFASTIERKKTRGRLFRHGPLIDLRRLMKKLQQKRLANRLAKQPENMRVVVPMSMLELTEQSRTVAA
ncbi:MAG: glycosyltransferase family 25 protein [Pirellula sp.]|jgi:glycosyl transferase family 25|nr:glycosyltransferase family 25 protein [Pirellula sp.]